MPVLNRGVDAAIVTALGKQNFHPIAFIELDWPGGFQRFHTNAGSIVFGGNTYTGVGKFGDVQLPDEGLGSIVSGTAEFMLYGNIGDILTDAESVVRNRPAKVYWGLTTERYNNTLIGTPLTVFNGYMDGLSVIVDQGPMGQKHALKLTLGNGPSARSFASITHSDEDQKSRYPNDTAGRHTIYARVNATKRTFPQT